MKSLMNHSYEIIVFAPTSPFMFPREYHNFRNVPKLLDAVSITFDALLQ